MKSRRVLPPVLDFQVRLVDEESIRPDMTGYVLWFNGDNSVLIDEPSYYGDGQGDHHVYRLSDGTRRNKPLYGAYRLDRKSLPTLQRLRARSRAITDVPAVYRRLIALTLAMTQYLPIHGDAGMS